MSSEALGAAGDAPPPPNAAVTLVPATASTASHIYNHDVDELSLNELSLAFQRVRTMIAFREKEDQAKRDELKRAAETLRAQVTIEARKLAASAQQDAAHSEEADVSAQAQAHDGQSASLPSPGWGSDGTAALKTSQYSDTDDLTAYMLMVRF